MLVRLFLLMMAVTTVRGVWLRFFPEAPEPSIASQVTSVMTCRNAQGEEFWTSNEARCREFETTYSCKIDDNRYVQVADVEACGRRQEEEIARRNGSFDPQVFAEQYKDALDVAAERTKNRSY